MSQDQQKVENSYRKLSGGIRATLSSMKGLTDQIIEIHSHRSDDILPSDYPYEWESIHTTQGGLKVRIRPITLSDNNHIQNFFQTLSEQNLYMRYLAPFRSLPRKYLKNFCKVDYSKNMTLIATTPLKGGRFIIVGIGQWVMDEFDQLPEVAFQIHDDWQGQGLGTYFFNRLIEIAMAYHLSAFKAEVLTNNAAMNRVFEKAEVPFTRSIETGVYSYLFDLQSGKNEKNR